MDWKKRTVCGSVVIYGAACICGAYFNGKDLLGKLCFTKADCRLAQDLGSEDFGTSPPNAKLRMVTTSTSTALPAISVAGPLSWPHRDCAFTHPLPLH